MYCSNRVLLLSIGLLVVSGVEAMSQDNQIAVYQGSVVDACKQLVVACKETQSRPAQELALQMVRDAVATGKDPNEKDENGHSGVKILGDYFGAHETPVCNLFPHVMLLLIEAQADVTSERYAAGGTLLHQVAGRGYVDLIKPLVKAGIGVDECDGRSLETPLRIAATMAEFCERTAKGNNGAVIQILLDLQADPNVRDCNGDTPLHWANTKESARLLIDNKANIEARNHLGRTPLIHAAGACFVDLVQILFENGALRSAKDGAGMTALDRALWYQKNGGDEKIRWIIGVLKKHDREKSSRR